MKSKKKTKMSAIIVAMAETIITRPVDLISDEASAAALILAAEAWNMESEPSEPSNKLYLRAVKQLQKCDKHFGTFLKSTNFEDLISELREFKRHFFPDDKRKIRTFEITGKGSVRVEWEEPQ